MSDEMLVQRYLAGDQEAFTILAERYRDRFYRLAVRMLHDSYEAEDAVQEVLLRLLNSLPNYRPVAKFGTWAYRLASNTIIAVHRRRANRPETLPESFDQADNPERSDPDQQCARAFQAQLINEALRSLPEQQRLLIILRDQEELSNNELAAVLGIDLGTLKARLHRARGALRRVLEAGVVVPGQEQVGRVQITTAVWS